MSKIPKDYYSNLLCYEEFVIRTNLLGYDVSDEDVLNSLKKVNGIDPYYWFIIGETGHRHICIVDKCGNKVDNVVLNGNFDCSFSPLDSLKGSPRQVCGDFDCSYRSSLISLEGAPEKVGGDFYCYDCKSLISLKGAPRKVGEDFNCYNCESLISLEGAPKKVGGQIFTK